MRLACPHCGGSYSINKRRFKRKRRTTSSCVHCHAKLAIVGLKAGDFKVEVLKPGQPQETEPPQAAESPPETGPAAPATAAPAPSDTIEELPENAFHHRGDSGGIPPLLPEELIASSDGEFAFTDRMRDKTDPDVGPVLLSDAPTSNNESDSGVGAMTAQFAPRQGGAVSQDTEISISEGHEDTDPGMGAPRAIESSGKKPVPVAAKPKAERVAAEPVKGPRAAKPKKTVLTAKPLILQMPDARAVKRPETDVNEMLREYSVMFRIDTGRKRRRNVVLTVAALAVTAGAIALVAFTGQGFDPSVLDELERAALKMEMRRATETSYLYQQPTSTDGKPGISKRVTMSALASSLAQIVHGRIDSAAKRDEKAAAAAQAKRAAGVVAKRAIEVERAASERTKAKAQRMSRAKRLRLHKLRRERRIKRAATKRAATKRRRQLPSFD